MSKFYYFILLLATIPALGMERPHNIELAFAQKVVHPFPTLKGLAARALIKAHATQKNSLQTLCNTANLPLDLQEELPKLTAQTAADILEKYVNVPVIISSEHNIDWSTFSNTNEILLKKNYFSKSSNTIKIIKYNPMFHCRACMEPNSEVTVSLSKLHNVSFNITKHLNSISFIDEIRHEKIDIKIPSNAYGDGQLHTLIFDPHYRFVLLIKDRGIYQYDIAHKRPTYRLADSEYLDISTDSSNILVKNLLHKKCLELRDTRTKQSLHNFTFESECTGLFHPHHPWIVAIVAGKICMYDSKTYQIIKEINLDFELKNARFESRGRLLANACIAGKLTPIVFDLSTSTYHVITDTEGIDILSLRVNDDCTLAFYKNKYSVVLWSMILEKPITYFSQEKLKSCFLGDVKSLRIPTHQTKLADIDTELTKKSSGS